MKRHARFEILPSLFEQKSGVTLLAVRSDGGIAL